MSNIDVYITSNTAFKLWMTIESLKTEVGGFGYAYWDEKCKSMVWDDVFLVPQLVSGSEVAFDGDGIAAAVERASADGRLGQDEFVWVSWHSHHSMAAFWSKTDEECIETYGKSGVTRLLSFVGCHDHRYKMRLDFFGVQHHGITIPQITMDDLRLTYDPDDIVVAEVMDDIDRNVKERPMPKATKPWVMTPKNQNPMPGDKLEEAFETLEDNGWLVGPEGLVGFDTMAWEGSE